MGIHGRLRYLMNTLDRRIFAAEDAVALVRGWEISRLPNGFGRVYRDPRWDSISACGLCRGAAESCPSCGGCGTVRCRLTDMSRGGAA